MGFKLSELILSVGDDNVAIQNLDACADSLDYNIRPTADVSIIPSDNNTYLRLVVQPQHGERAEYRVSVGAVDVLFHELAGMADVAASPVTPEGLSGGDDA